MSNVRDFVASLHELNLGSVPEPVVRQAKRTLLDTLLVAWAGRESSLLQTIRVSLPEVTRGGARVWFDGTTAPAPEAALLNALAASALDFDTLNLSVHPDALTVPAILAVADIRRVDGKQALLALIAGNELICRLARSASGTPRGWSPTSIYGGYGTALAASMAMALDVDHSLNALGLAHAGTSGNQQATVERTQARKLQPALSCRHGVQSAVWAAGGVSGPHDFLEGPYGLWSLYQSANADIFFQGAGAEFHSMETGFKIYPVCGANHATLAALDKLLAQTSIDPENIATIEAGITPLASRLAGNPYDATADPMVLAQYCLSYAVAARLLYGQVGLRELDTDKVLGPGVAELANRVSVHTPHTPADPLALAPAELVVTLRDGRALRATEDHVPGSAEAPISDAVFFEKLSCCAQYGSNPMSDERLAGLVDLVMNLETLDDIRVLGKAISPQN